MSALLSIRNGMILVLLAAGMSACTGDNDDLDEKINAIKAIQSTFV